jgi:hypothetical protein
MGSISCVLFVTHSLLQSEKRNCCLPAITCFYFEDLQCVCLGSKVLQVYGMMFLLLSLFFPNIHATKLEGSARVTCTFIKLEQEALVSESLVLLSNLISRSGWFLKHKFSFSGPSSLLKICSMKFCNLVSFSP